MTVVGVHGHETVDHMQTIHELNDALNSLRHVQSFGLCVLGDFNVDQCSLNHPSDSLQTARNMLASWANARRSNIVVPRVCDRSPGAAFELQGHIVSRIPWGDQAQFQKPSLLDYVVSTESELGSKIHWSLALGDHAALCVNLVWDPEARPRSKSHWVCVSEDSAVKYVAEKHLESICCPEDKSLQNLKKSNLFDQKAVSKMENQEFL